MSYSAGEDDAVQRGESGSLRAAGKVEAGFMVKDWLSAYLKLLRAGQTTDKV